MDTPAGHYSVFRVPFQIDADGDCTRCGLKIEPDEDTLEPHECPPGCTDPAMSWSKGLKRYNGVEQDDEGAYVYYDEHIAALRRAKAEVLREVKYEALGSRIKCFKSDTLYAEGNDDALNALVKWIDARAAQIEEGEDLK